MLRILLLAASISLHAGGAAASAPRCTPQREGEVACLHGKLCECRHDPGGSLTGRRPGTRWDCGTLRPACGAAPDAGQADAGQTDYRAFPAQPLPFPLPGPRW